MVTVSSAFISSRRERIIFSVLSASLCAFKAAALVEVLREVLADEVFEDLGKTDWDNTDVARDHSFHCIAGANLAPTDHTTHVGLMVSISSTPLAHSLHFQLPSGFRSPVDDRLIFRPVRNAQAGARYVARRPAWSSGTR